MSGIYRATRTFSRPELGIMVEPAPMCTTPGCGQPIEDLFKEAVNRLDLVFEGRSGINDQVYDQSGRSLEQKEVLQHILDTLGEDDDIVEKMNEALDEIKNQQVQDLEQEIVDIKNNDDIDQVEKDQHLTELNEELTKAQNMKARDAYRLKYGRYPGLSPCCRQSISFPRLYKDNRHYDLNLIDNQMNNLEAFRNMRRLKELPELPKPKASTSSAGHLTLVKTAVEDDASKTETGNVVLDEQGQETPFDQSHPSLVVEKEVEEDLNSWRIDQRTGVTLKPGQKVIGYLLVGGKFVVPQIDAGIKFEHRHWSTYN